MMVAPPIILAYVNCRPVFPCAAEKGRSVKLRRIFGLRSDWVVVEHPAEPCPLIREFPMDNKKLYEEMKGRVVSNRNGATQVAPVKVASRLPREGGPEAIAARALSAMPRRLEP
jgi:hypothetical protein